MLKKIIIFFIILSLINVGAVKVEYNLYEGRLSSENSTLIKTSVPVTNVNIVGYTCLDLECNNLGQRIFDNKIINSGINRSVELKYPEYLLNSYGYAVYYFKDGYIPWESNPSWSGLDSETHGHFNIYLTKKESCSNSINNLNINNFKKPYLPLSIFIDSSINFKTSADIINSGPLKAVPGEIENQYYVKQQIKLQIFNDEKNLIKEEFRDVFVKFGDNKTLDFNFIPTKKGKHKIILTSKIIDNKCLSSQETSISKEITVLSDEISNNLCYNLFNDLKLNSFSFKAGDTIIISGQKLNNLVIP